MAPALANVAESRATTSDCRALVGGARPRLKSVISTPPARTWLPLAAVGVTLVLWASAFVAIRHLGHDFSPGALSLGRLLVGAACLAVVALAADSHARAGAT